MKKIKKYPHGGPHSTMLPEVTVTPQMEELRDQGFDITQYPDLVGFPKPEAYTGYAPDPSGMSIKQLLKTVQNLPKFLKYIKDIGPEKATQLGDKLQDVYYGLTNIKGPKATKEVSQRIDQVKDLMDKVDSSSRMIKEGQQSLVPNINKFFIESAKKAERTGDPLMGIPNPDDRLRGIRDLSDLVKGRSQNVKDIGSQIESAKKLFFNPYVSTPTALDAAKKITSGEMDFMRAQNQLKKITKDYDDFILGKTGPVADENLDMIFKGTLPRTDANMFKPDFNFTPGEGAILDMYMNPFKMNKYGGSNMKKYENGGDPPVKQPEYLQYKGANYFNEGNPAYDLETYQDAITRDSLTLSNALFPGWDFETAKRLQLNRQLRNKIQSYTNAEIKDLNLVGKQYTGPAVDMDMFMQQYMESGIDDQAYGGEIPQYKGGGLWANIHAKRKRIAAGSGEKMRKPGSKGAPTKEALKRSQAAYGGKYRFGGNPDVSMDPRMEKILQMSTEAMIPDNMKRQRYPWEQPGYLGPHSPELYAKDGGKFTNVDYEAEGGEVVIGDISINKKYNGGTAKQYKGASMYMLGGPSHADGGIGIKMNSDEPSYVFTDRLKIGGKKSPTYADEAAKFGNRLDEVTTMAMGGDSYDRATAKLMKPRIMSEVSDLFNKQEQFKKENNIDQEPRKAAFGLAALGLGKLATAAGMSKALTAAQFLPGIFNMAKGAFAKDPTLEYEKIVPEMQEYQDFTGLADTYMSTQDRSLAGLRRGLEGSGATGAQLRGNLQTATTSSQANANNFFQQLGQMQAQSNRETDILNYNRRMQADVGNREMEMMADQFAMQNSSAPAFSQGLSQVLGTASTMGQQGIQQNFMNQLFGLGNNATANSSFTPNQGIMNNAPSLGNIGILDEFPGLLG
tara:strand:- start:17191 stop:19899 length:2709 start_codon:yes stop_codon:yes gene_type:complete